MKLTCMHSTGLLAALILFHLVLSAAGSQSLPGQVPLAVKVLNLSPSSGMAATQRLNLAIGLPLRHQEELTNFLKEVYDPASPNYRHYLKPDQFVERFGPSEADYEAVVTFLQTNGWTVKRPDPGRMLINAQASVVDIERVCHVKMHVYPHPREARTFFAPDREPSLDLAIPITDISGLNNYRLPRPAGLHSMGAGSAAGGSFIGTDFRKAYAPGVTLDGSGQILGLLEFGGYYTNDIQRYETEAGLPHVTLTNVLVDSFDGIPTRSAVGEVSLDIETAIAMAPGLAKIIVYETGDYGNGNDLLAQMANDGTATQISSSWFWGAVNATTTTYLQRLAAQGQSFFEASGDDLAYSPDGITLEANAGPPNGNPYLTSVGGTTLTTDAAGNWISETTWNNNYTDEGTNGSSGGISTIFGIPSWQTNTSMAVNGGSTTWRNVPDVALTADRIWVISDNGNTNWFWGTSCAAPLWAGFCALINQKAAAHGLPPVGLINPALYQLGNSPQYGALFHDITTGNNTNAISPNLYFACAGYDLCTGWGTPTGINLINALALSDPLEILLATGFTSGGAAGGPFYPLVQNFYLTNNGASALTWSVTDPSALFSISPAGGALPPGGQTSVAVTLTAAANNLGTGLYLPSLIFSNSTLGAEQVRQLKVQVGLPPLTFDDLNYDSDWSELPAAYGSLNWSNFYLITASTYGASGYAAGAVSSPNVIYNGGAEAASLSSLVPFDLLSAELTAAWNNNLIFEARGYNDSTLTYDITNTLSATQPTLIPFNFFGVTRVEFSSSGGTKHSGYSGSGHYFVMDGVVAVTHTTPDLAPLLGNASYTAGAIGFDWHPNIGRTYQVQYNTNLLQNGWINLGIPLTATNSLMIGFDVSTNGQRFYRIGLLP